MYTLCREQELFTVEKSAGKNKTKRIVVPWTISFKLPEPGGMFDQPHRLMEFFGHFMAGDRQAAHNRMNAPTN